MDTNEPYTLGCDGRDRSFCVVRKCDGFYAGYVRQTDEGLWQLQNMQEIDYEGIPPFPSRNEAALFLCMSGRVYQTTVEAPINATASLERIQIRVSPNFGQWYAGECVPGLWAASLHHEDGRCAGATCCAASVAEAKIAGIQQAHLPRLAQEEARLKSEQLSWEGRAEIPN